MMTRWKNTEPVRLYLYGILGPALVVLMAYGFVTSEQMAVWGGLGTALLAVPGVEAARSKVYAPANAVAPADVAARRLPDGSIVAGPAAPGATEEGDIVEVARPAAGEWG